MTISASTHLNFTGTARSALEFYQSIFGGDLMVATYSDFGAPSDSPDAARVVFGQVTAPDGFTVMAYDVPSSGDLSPASTTAQRVHGTTQTDSPFFVSLRGDDVDEMTRTWKGLAQDASVVEPLAPAQWAPLFGMLTDKYGVTWVIDVAAPYGG